MRLTWFIAAGVLALAGCAPRYGLVSPATVGVAKGKMRVTPGIAWNRAPRNGGDIAEVERWTQNGPLLDELTLIGGLAEGRAITKQRAKADQKLPVFAAGMSPRDLTAMIETLHRVHGDAVFDTLGVAPRALLGQPGLQYDYGFVGADDVRRRGRAVMAVVDHRLYLIMLEAAASHYYEAALPDVERMANSATLG